MKMEEKKNTIVLLMQKAAVGLSMGPQLPLLPEKSFASCNL